MQLIMTSTDMCVCPVNKECPSNTQGVVFLLTLGKDGKELQHVSCTMEDLSYENYGTFS